MQAGIDSGDDTALLKEIWRLATLTQHVPAECSMSATSDSSMFRLRLLRAYQFVMKKLHRDPKTETRLYILLLNTLKQYNAGSETSVAQVRVEDSLRRSVHGPIPEKVHFKDKSMQWDDVSIPVNRSFQLIPPPTYHQRKPLDEKGSRSLDSRRVLQVLQDMEHQFGSNTGVSRNPKLKSDHSQLASETKLQSIKKSIQESKQRLKQQQISMTQISADVMDDTYSASILSLRPLQLPEHASMTFDVGFEPVSLSNKSSNTSVQRLEQRAQDFDRTWKLRQAWNRWLALLQHHQVGIFIVTNSNILFNVM
jgi:hypothetical protein